MSSKSHSRRILTCVKFKDVHWSTRYCSKIMASIWKLNFWTVFERSYIFISIQWLSILLNIHHPQFVWISDNQMQSWRMEWQTQCSLGLIFCTLNSLLFIVPYFNALVLSSSGHQRLSDAYIHTDYGTIMELKTYLLKY